MVNKKNSKANEKITNFMELYLKLAYFISIIERFKQSSGPQFFSLVFMKEKAKEFSKSLQLCNKLHKKHFTEK